MQFNIKTDVLKKMVSTVIRVVSVNNAQPILGSILIELQQNGLLIMTGFDGVLSGTTCYGFSEFEPSPNSEGFESICRHASA